MGAKEARLLRKQHVSKDLTRKLLVLAEEAEAVPEESEHSGEDIHKPNTYILHFKKSGTCQHLLACTTFFNDWVLSQPT